MLPDPPPQCGGYADPQIRYVSGSDLPRIHHGNVSSAEGNVSWSHETDPVKNKKNPEIFKRILRKIKHYYDLLQVHAERVFKIINITTSQIISYST